MSASYFQVRAKCLVCGLHFILCTDRPAEHGPDALHCPECGQRSGVFVAWVAQVEGFIWQAVPGDAELWTRTE